MIIQGQCQALLETEEKDKPVFAWVLWQHQSPTSAGAEVYVYRGCNLLSPTVGAASPLITSPSPCMAILGDFYCTAVTFSTEVWPLSLGSLISLRLQYLLLQFLKYSLLPSLLHYLLHHSLLLPLICLSLLLPWAGEESVAGIGMLGLFCRTPALPASWTYSLPYS